MEIECHLQEAEKASRARRRAGLDSSAKGCDVLQSLIMRPECSSVLCEVDSRHGTAKAACEQAAEATSRVGMKAGIVSFKRSRRLQGEEELPR